MSIGIDKIGFATSQYVLKMADLALARGAEPEKFSKGLMLDATSITPITEDIVTLASDAATDILNDDDKKAIDMVIVATESSIDQSKAAAVYVHSLLGIQPFARSYILSEKKRRLLWQFLLNYFCWVSDFPWMPLQFQSVRASE